MAAIGEIGVMGGVDRPGDDAALDENRLAEHDVGEVGAGTGIGVVANEDIAWLASFRPGGASGFQG